MQCCFCQVESVCETCCECHKAFCDECNIQVANTDKHLCRRCFYEKMDDVSRMIRNQVWAQGGCEAIEDMDRRIETCTECGHRSEEQMECPICGARKFAQRKK